MDENVQTSCPGIGEQGVDQLARIEHRRGRIAQQRYARILLRLPEGPPALLPFSLHALIERIIIVPGVAIAELAAAPEGRAETEQEQTAKTAEYQRNDEPALTVHESPRSLQDRSNRGIVGPARQERNGNGRIAGMPSVRFQLRSLDHPITRCTEKAKSRRPRDPSRSPHRGHLPLRRTRTRR